MRLRTPLLPLLAVAVFGVAACDGQRSVSISTGDSGDKPRGVLKVVETLQCPEVQGELTRKGAATDGGTTCWYVGPRGSSVQLRLIRLDGDPTSVLEGLESELRRDISGGPTGEGPQVAVNADGDRASVRLPGVSVDAEGENADVRIGGFRIEAKNDSPGATAGAAASASDDSVSVRADEGGAEVRVRAQGDATRAKWILTDGDDAATGWRLVGYEARGPQGGPLVAALVRSKNDDKEAAFEDAEALVSLNVGD
ncbi:MAG TPA: methyltransferase type 11 [Brevundimonas sp.]|uniref:methyltransferase type 11 n=1 Tax=Brevundimonas sp. TaxID=1871086 RepID=UPI002DF11E5C|nr:methyltransferase type 11 [Brevundimonas sp.]